MKDKWQNFYKVQSPVDITKPNLGASNILADWQRGSSDEEPTVKITVNGKPLSSFVNDYNHFQTEEDLKQFFCDEILSQTSASKEEKERMVEHLMTSFHQGGFLNPVSAAMFDATKHAGVQLQNSTRTQDTRIISTEKGFKVQEFFTAPTLIAIDDQIKRTTKDYQSTLDEYGPKAAESAACRILPDEGYDAVIVAEGTIDVDLSAYRSNANAAEPSVSVESSSISYGNQAVQALMDKRSLGQRIVDFFKNILGLAEVKEITPATPKLTSPAADDSTPKDEGPRFSPSSR